MIAATEASPLQYLLPVVAVSGVLPLIYLIARERSPNPFFPRRAEPFGHLDVPGRLLHFLALLLLYHLVLSGVSGPSDSLAIAGGIVMIFAAIGFARLGVLPVLRPVGSPMWRLGTGLLLLWAALPLVFGVYMLLQALGAEGTQATVEQLAEKKPGWRGVRFFAGIVAPVVEEVGFRGLLYPALRQWRGPRLAIAMSALLFALVHWPPNTWAPLLILAGFLAYSVETTGSIMPAIAGHLVFNALTILPLL